MKRSIVPFILFCFSVMAIGIFVQWRSQHNPPVVRIGISPWPGYEYLYLAEQKGFFKQEGLNVQMKQFSSAEEDVRSAFERLQIEGMCNTIADMLRAYEHTGRMAKIVLVTDYSDGADKILAKSSIHSVKELKGKRVGVESMSLGMVMLARAVEREGMTLQDLKILNFGQAEMASALKSGKVDAVVTYSPVSLEIEHIPHVHTIFDSSMIPGEIVDIVAVDSKVLTKHPHIVPALHRVWARTLAYAQQHPQESDNIMAAREGIDAASFVKSLKGISIMQEKDQKSMLAPGGTIEKSVAVTAATLTAVQALNINIKSPAQFIARVPNHPR